MNVIFFIGGASILGLGIFMCLSAEWADVYGSGLQKYAYGTITFGALTMCVSFLGCCGSKRRSRPLLLTYGAILFVLLVAQGITGYYLYDRFWGSLPQECVRKGFSYVGASKAALMRPDDTSLDLDATVNCGDFLQSKLRITAYVLWQKLYRDYLLYNSSPTKHASFKTNARIAKQLATRSKCCGFGAPVEGGSKPCKANGEKADFFQYDISYQRCSVRTAGAYCQWRLGPAPKYQLVANCNATSKYDMPIGCDQRVQKDQGGGTRAPCFEYGCGEAAYEFLRKHVYIIGTVLLLLVLAELVGILVACLVMNPFVIFGIIFYNLCLGIQKLVAGFHKLLHCLSKPCKGAGEGGGGAGGGRGQWGRPGKRRRGRRKRR
eukprot:g3338.t1